MQYLNETIYHKQLGFKSYQEYLISDLWREKRQEYRQKGLPFECVFCSKPTPILHHLDYSSLGNENIYKDLIPVCQKHHTECHFRGKVKIPLVKNMLVKRKEELIFKYHGGNLLQKIGRVKMGDAVNSGLEWLWVSFRVN